MHQSGYEIPGYKKAEETAEIREKKGKEGR